jgi:hypothetical protein
MDNEAKYSALRVVDLRKELKIRGASTTGRKSVLIQRLVLLDKAMTAEGNVDTEQSKKKSHFSSIFFSFPFFFSGCGGSGF